MWQKSSYSNGPSMCLEWRKSSHSQGNGQCAEVAPAVQVRDSKDPDGPVLGFTARQWTAFTEGLK